MNEDEVLSKGVNIINSYQIGSIEGSGYSYNNEYANQYYYVSNVKGLGSFDYGYQGFILHTTQSDTYGIQVIKSESIVYQKGKKVKIGGKEILGGLKVSYDYYKDMVEVYNHRDIEITSGYRTFESKSSLHRLGLATDYNMYYKDGEGKRRKITGGESYKELEKILGEEFINKYREKEGKGYQEIFFERSNNSSSGWLHIALKGEDKLNVKENLVGFLTFNKGGSEEKNHKYTYIDNIIDKNKESNTQIIEWLEQKDEENIKQEEERKNN